MSTPFTPFKWWFVITISFFINYFFIRLPSLHFRLVRQPAAATTTAEMIASEVRAYISTNAYTSHTNTLYSLAHERFGHLRYAHVHAHKRMNTLAHACSFALNNKTPLNRGTEAITLLCLSHEMLPSLLLGVLWLCYGWTYFLYSHIGTIWRRYWMSVAFRQALIKLSCIPICSNVSWWSSVKKRCVLLSIIFFMVFFNNYFLIFA